MTRGPALGWLLTLALTQAGCTARPTRPDPSNVSPDASPTLGPIEADAPSRWVDVSLVGDEVYAAGCAVESSGALWCWGHDPILQAGLRPELGLQDRFARLRRSPVSRVRDVDDARRVAVSLEQVCRIDGDGRVRCLGESRSWREIEGVEQAVELDVVDFRACARQADDSLLCWEDDGAPVLVAEGVRTFSVERPGGCAIAGRDELLCWNQAVQRGQPISLATSEGRLPGVVDIDLAWYADAVWMLDDQGRVFHAYLRSHAEQLEWKQIGEVPQGVEIVSARSNVCVRTLAGSVFCHGLNQYGQAGIGDSAPREGFVAMNVSGAEGLAVTDLRSCIRTRDEVACAGLDVSELEPPVGTVHQHTLADLVATALAAEGNTTCALDSTGNLRCWGWDLLDLSQLPDEGGFGVELAVRPTLVSQGEPRIHGIVSNANTLDWIDQQGRLRTELWTGAPEWSLQDFQRTKTGSPPNPSVIRRLVADHVQCTIGAGKNVDVLSCGIELRDRAPLRGIEGPVAVATEHLHICAINRRDRVQCVAHPDLYEYPTIVPELVRGVDEARSIAMSGREACALVEGGRVLCWSGKRVEHYEDDDGSFTFEYEASPVIDTGLDDVVVIVGNHDGFCSLDGHGAVRCWRAHGTIALPGPTLEEEVVELVAGAEHFCARDRNGAVTCWGDEAHGQLGRIPPAVSLQPRALQFGEDG